MSSDLIAWAECLDVSLPSGFWGTLSECSRILSPQDQRAILEVVYLVREGFEIRAEIRRRDAGYDYDARKANRAERGLPSRLERSAP